ncbi:MAG: hypothetical protein AVDCRST_MAG18-5066, partial [uncultured Thermomicrobiales bacterium]
VCRYPPRRAAAAGRSGDRSPRTPAARTRNTASARGARPPSRLGDRRLCRRRIVVSAGTYHRRTACRTRAARVARL